MKTFGMKLLRVVLKSSENHHQNRCNRWIVQAGILGLCIFVSSRVVTPAATGPDSHANNFVGQVLINDLRSENQYSRTAAMKRLEVIYDQVSQIIAADTEANIRRDSALDPKSVKLMRKFQSPLGAELCAKEIDFNNYQKQAFGATKFEAYCCAETLIAYGASSVPHIYFQLRSTPPEFLTEKRVLLFAHVLFEVFGKEFEDGAERKSELLRSLEKQMAKKGVVADIDQNFARVINAVKQKTPRNS